MGGTLPEPVDEQELDLCLMKAAHRVVQAHGSVDFENVTYRTDNLKNYVGHRLILKAMNHAAKVRRRDDPKPIVVESVTPLGVEVILVDNAHNLDLEALSDLKDLYDETGVTIIFFGKPDLDVSLDEAESLGSFPYSYSLAPLSEADFKKVLDTIEEKALNLSSRSFLSEGEKFEILTTSTGSLIGRLMKLLPTAILYSVQKVSK